MNNAGFGKLGEEEAANYLNRKGFVIIARNFRCRMGEIDIVAREGRTIVFIEVKTRLSTQCGQPFEAVNYDKQQRLVRLAQYYLKVTFRTVCIPCRIDVIGIIVNNGIMEIKHIKNAICLM